MSLNLNLSKPMAIIGVFIGAILVLALAAGFLPSIFSNVAAVTENLTNGDVGNAQANTILGVFGFIVPVILVLGILGVILAAAVVSRK